MGAFVGGDKIPEEELKSHTGFNLAQDHLLQRLEQDRFVCIRNNHHPKNLEISTNPFSLPTITYKVTTPYRSSINTINLYVKQK